MLPVGDQVLPGGGRGGGGGDSATLSAAMPMTLLYNQSLRKPNRCLLVGEMSRKMKYFWPLFDNLLCLEKGRNSTADLRCIQCHRVDMTLDAPKIICLNPPFSKHRNVKECPQFEWFSLM